MSDPTPRPASPAGPAVLSATSALPVAGLLIPLVLMGCFDAPPGKPDAPAGTGGQGTAGQSAASESEPPAPPAPGPAPESLPAVVRANTAFGIDLYRRLSEATPGKNVFLSPYSVSVALTMAAEGARGETAEEFGRVLQLPDRHHRSGPEAGPRPWDLAPMHAGLGWLQRRFDAGGYVPPSLRARVAKLKAEHEAARKAAEGKRDAGKRDLVEAAEAANRIAEELNALYANVDRYELRVANRLWVDRSFPLAQPFTDMLDAHYRTGSAVPVDFAGNPEAAVREINGWVSRQTEGRIPEVLGPVEPQNVRLMLANAVYFLGRWVEPFEPADTRDEDFHLSAGRTAKTPMMNGYLRRAGYAAFNGDGSPFRSPEFESGRNYPDADGFQALELPYKGRDLAMLLLVPRASDGLGRLETLLSEGRLSEWAGRLDRRNVRAALPKFRITTSYRLNAPLKAMGLRRAFDEKSADLSGVGGKPAGEGGLFVSLVEHRAFVDVDEKGTEAAAVTIIWESKKDEPRQVPFIPVVRADRPFLFLIRDAKTGAVLFLGRVTDPTARP